MTDREAIAAIGTRRVASAMGVSEANVSHWKRRGVPWRLRHKFAYAAADFGLDLPYSFVEERS